MKWRRTGLVRTPRFHSPRTLIGLLTVLLLSAPVACSKPQPSEEYFQAHTRFSKLYAEQGDGAFADPSLDEVEALLARVPTDSLDAKAAQELRQRIQTGRTRVQAEAQARQEAVAQARAPSVMPAGFTTPDSPSDSATRAEETADAGSGSSAPSIGTLASELASGFSGCFQQGEQVEVLNRGVRDRWELADRGPCRQQYAALADQVLLIEEGKVLALVPKSSLQSIPVDGGSK